MCAHTYARVGEEWDHWIVTDCLRDEGQVSPYATTQSHLNYAVTLYCTTIGFNLCEY